MRKRKEERGDGKTYRMASAVVVRGDVGKKPPKIILLTAHF